MLRQGIFNDFYFTLIAVMSTAFIIYCFPNLSPFSYFSNHGASIYMFPLTKLSPVKSAETYGYNY